MKEDETLDLKLADKIGAFLSLYDMTITDFYQMKEECEKDGMKPLAFVMPAQLGNLFGLPIYFDEHVNSIRLECEEKC